MTNEGAGTDDTTPPSDVTRLLQEMGEREDAANELLSIVYEKLQGIARARLGQEAAGHSLQATALVHEAYVRLAGGQAIPWKNRTHFFRVAAEAMRRVLVDHARRRRSEKRGGDRRRVPITQLDLAVDDDVEDLLALEEAMKVLEAEDARAARIVELRTYAGLTVDQVAEALEISPRTVAREWAYARARLFELMGYGAPG